MASNVSNVGVIDKSVVLLDAIERGPCSLAELVDRSELPRATAHRLAQALEAHGLVRRRPDGRFVLGYRLHALGQKAAEQNPLIDLAEPHLLALRDETGESTQVYVREGDARVCVLAAESTHGLRTIVEVGERLTMERGSAATVLRGDVGPGQAAATVGERQAGAASVSAGIVGPDGAVVAAISVSGPIGRLSDDPKARYGQAVQDKAAAVSAALLQAT